MSHRGDSAPLMDARASVIESSSTTFVDLTAASSHTDSRRQVARTRRVGCLTLNAAQGQPASHRRRTASLHGRHSCLTRGPPEFPLRRRPQTDGLLPFLLNYIVRHFYYPIPRRHPL